LDKIAIKYHPDLIDELCEQHKRLLQHLEFVRRLIKDEKIKQLPLALELFRGELLEHASKEILQLYVYLRNSIDKQSDEYNQVKQLRKAMNNVLYKMLTFLDESHDIDINDLEKDPDAKDKFLKSIQRMIDLFSQRVSVEEKVLFPMYQPVKEAI